MTVHIEAEKGQIAKKVLMPGDPNRALYIANMLGLDAYGVNSDPREYVGATYRELREILARNKDFVKCIFKPEPTYLGDTIPVSGSGDVTNDK